MKPYEKWDLFHINYWRFASISSIYSIWIWSKLIENRLEMAAVKRQCKQTRLSNHHDMTGEVYPAELHNYNYKNKYNYSYYLQYLHLQEDLLLRTCFPGSLISHLHRTNKKRRDQSNQQQKQLRRAYSSVVLNKKLLPNLVPQHSFKRLTPIDFMSPHHQLSNQGVLMWQIWSPLGVVGVSQLHWTKPSSLRSRRRHGHDASVAMAAAAYKLRRPRGMATFSHRWMFF